MHYGITLRNQIVTFCLDSTLSKVISNQNDSMTSSIKSLNISIATVYAEDIYMSLSYNEIMQISTDEVLRGH